MTLQSFESLRVWHESRSLTARIYAVAREGAFARDFGLRDQLCRAAVSIMSNIAEGYERENRKALPLSSAAHSCCACPERSFRADVRNLGVWAVARAAVPEKF